MAENVCITAFTEFRQPPSGEYVQYINISREPDGHVKILARASDGNTHATLYLTPEQWAAFRADVITRG